MISSLAELKIRIICRTKNKTYLFFRRDARECWFEAYSSSYT